MDRSGPITGQSPFQLNEKRLPPPNQGLRRLQLDFSNSHLQIQKKMEQERERMLCHGKPQSLGLYDPKSDHEEEIV